MNEVGIDFGTTNSCAAAFIPGVAEPILIPALRPIPSLVLYSGEEVLVGESARAKWITDGDSAAQTGVASVKRLMWGRFLDVHLHTGDNLSVTDVAGRIFSALQEQSKETLKKRIKSAVIAVPVGFLPGQRQLIRQAAELAGIQVKTFIHEPFAALLPLIGGKPDGHYFIYDWGGGTLDITLVAKEGRLLRQVAVGSLNDLAGDDFDRMFSFNVAKEFFAKEGKHASTEALSPAIRERLKIQCEAGKRELSERDDTTLTIPLFWKGKPLLQQVSRSKFEAWIAKDLERGVLELLATFERSGIDASSLREVILVGGSSKIPLLKRSIEAVMSCPVSLPSKAEFLIANGAAWASRASSGMVLASDIQLRIPSRSIPDPTSQLFPLFRRGDKVGYGGVRISREFYCTDWSRSELRLVICFDGQTHRVLSWKLPEQLLRMAVRDVSYPQPANLHLKIGFEIDENLALKVTPLVAGKSLEPSLIQDLRFAIQMN